MKSINFCSGPAMLPSSIYTGLSEALIDYNASGLSLLELSHRSSHIVDMIEETKLLMRELLQVSDDFEILFLQGGASMQFCTIPMNFLRTNTSAHYALTGQWAGNAYKEAQRFGNCKVICDSSDNNFSYLPKLNTEYLFENASYAHFTSNNTIYGTQWKSIPKCNIPVIVDMSSDILSKRIDVDQYDLIYASAQKNIGIAGVCLVIIKKELLQRQNSNIPTMFDYAVHVKNSSSFNTPPVCAIYTCNLNLKWLKALGGVSKIEQLNEEKAALLYQEIERNSLFECKVKNSTDRSLMNVTFIASTSAIEEKFKQFCKVHRIIGIDGYRTVGGFRASIYNAMPKDNIIYFMQLMKQFEQENMSSNSSSNR